MELLVIFAVLAAFAIVDERQSRRAMFPAGTCVNCPVPIHFDWKRHEWIHDNGEVWQPLPTTGLPHNAYPNRGYDTLSD